MSRRGTIEILDQERNFNIDELFFSITDKKGVIQRCNDVFARISAYTIDEILGAPHIILRHPDMPRVVFKLLWDTIEAGQTIAAYVKNLAKDGRYYWVLAVVMPTEGGYLSIRLKPSSPLFNKVREIYRELLTVERIIESESKRRPEAMAASGARLQELLRTHGFQDYSAFMHNALSAEMIARQDALKSLPARAGAKFHHAGLQSGSVDFGQLVSHFSQLDANLQNLFDYLDEFRAMNVLLLERSNSMLENAATIRLLSLNATVAASQLGARANTLGVVAGSLGEASIHSEQVIVQMAQDMKVLVASLSSLIFEVAAIKLQSEVSNDFMHEVGNDATLSSNNVNDSLCTLAREVSKRISTVYQTLADNEGAFAILRKRVEQLLRNVQTLRFVQFAGLKESVAMNGAEAFAVVFEEARLQIEKTRNECDQLAQRVENCQKRLRSIRDARCNVLAHTAAMANWADSVPSLF